MTKESDFNKVKKEMEDVDSNRGFSMSRVPKNVRESFIKYAMDEWADDRGAAFSHIWKHFEGECNSGHEEINTKMDILADEIVSLKKEIEDIKTQFNKKQEKKEPKEEDVRLDGTIGGKNE